MKPHNFDRELPLLLGVLHVGFLAVLLVELELPWLGFLHGVAGGGTPSCVMCVAAGVIHGALP